MGYDFNFYYLAGRAILAGQSPYLIDGFMSPLMFAVLMAPFGLLAWNVAYALWVTINVAALITIVKKEYLRVIWYLPVTFALIVGQMDIGIIALGFSGTWWGLALTTLKPQWAAWFFAMRILRLREKKDYYDLLKTTAATLILHLPAFVLNPTWMFDMLKNSPSTVHYAEHAASIMGVLTFVDYKEPRLWTLGLVAVVVFALLFNKSRQSNFAILFWRTVAIFNPIANAYSLCILLKEKIDNKLILLSWVAMGLAVVVHSGLPFVLLPFYVSMRDVDWLSVKETLRCRILRMSHSSSVGREKGRQSS